MLSPTAFVTEWTSIGYCKTSDFFFCLIFPVSSPPSLTTMRFAHSSSMNTSLGEFSKFPILARTTNPFRQFLPKGENLPVWDFRKMEDVPEKENKTSISKSNKKQAVSL